MPTALRMVTVYYVWPSMHRNKTGLEFFLRVCAGELRFLWQRAAVSAVVRASLGDQYPRVSDNKRQKGPPSADMCANSKLSDPAQLPLLPTAVSAHTSRKEPRQAGKKNNKNQKNKTKTKKKTKKPD